MEFSKNIKNAKYPEFISENRRPVKTPKNMVVDGKSVFGTFDGPFEKLNIETCCQPLKMHCPFILQKRRIKAWEAFEVSFDEGFLLGAVYSIGVAMTNILLFFDKKTKKIYSNQVFAKYDAEALSDTLIKGGYTHLKASRIDIGIINNFDKGFCLINAESKSEKNKTYMKADIRLESITMPSVCVMPLGENRPLYSQKEMFKAIGKIVIDNREIILGEEAVAIIDDHKGYYPYNMHYDWTTGLGYTKEDGAIGFNLTKNQVINPKNYNENFLWLNGEMHPLPPVIFDKKENGDWVVSDEYDTVNITYHIENAFKIKVNVGLIKIDYTAPFGYHSGYIRDLNGNKHSVDGLFGMGEDKTYRI